MRSARDSAGFRDFPRFQQAREMSGHIMSLYSDSRCTCDFVEALCRKSVVWRRRRFLPGYIIFLYTSARILCFQETLSLSTAVFYNSLHYSAVSIYCNIIHTRIYLYKIIYIIKVYINVINIISTLYISRKKKLSSHKKIIFIHHQIPQNKILRNKEKY